ncbi:hypothetical protein Tco_0188553, partial [Tanacetum coccineum]
MQGSGRTLQQRKEDLFDEYERFRAIGNESIHDYFVEGLKHNLFSVGQFCDGGLEVAFRQHSCHIRNYDMVDLLK